MHELSLTYEIRKIIEEYAEVHSFQRVRTVRIEVGELSAVEPESIRFCFDVVMRGSVAEGATLEIRQTPDAAALKIREIEVE